MEVAEYGLTRLAGRHTFVPISQADYEGIVEAKRGLLECLLLEEGFDLIVENYLELEVTLLDATVRDLVGDPPLGERSHADMSVFNRRFANLLTVCKMYIDQAPQRIHRLFPAGDHGQDPRTAFSEQFDGRSGYRVMEALRNHAQHYGFPTQAVTYHAALVEPYGTGAVRVTVSPYLVLDDARRNEEFKKSVLQELNSLGEEKLDLKPLVRDYVEGLWSVHGMLRSDLRVKVKAWEAVLDEALLRFQSRYLDEGKLPGLAAVVCNSDGEILDATELPRHMLENRRRLERKNRGLDNLTKKFVTSEADEPDRRTRGRQSSASPPEDAASG